eukprot:432759_1
MKKKKPKILINNISMDKDDNITLQSTPKNDTNIHKNNDNNLQTHTITGYSADDRSVGHIALTDWDLKTKANIFVKPSQDIISYIEPLISLNSDLLSKYGYT